MATACYDPAYFPCSYKGVAFEAMEVSSEHGRRGAEGEFPFGENTGYADLGRRIRVYSVRGRFATNDHVQRANALIAVCEAPGPGPLMHPTRGIVNVACRSLNVTDDPMSGQGVTYVDLELVEANVWGNGFNLSSLLQTGLSIVALIAATGGSFNNGYRPRQAKPYNADAILATASTAILQIRDEYKEAAVRGMTTNPNTWSAIFDLERRAADTTVLYDAEETFRTLRLGAAAIAASTDADTMYQAFLRIANSNAVASAMTGLDEVSQDAVYSAMRSISAGYMARASLQETDVNAQDVFVKYQQISSILGQEIERSRQLCDNVLYLELRNFYTAMQTALLNRVYSLPALVIYNFRKSVHSLVAAYEIYNDARKAPYIETQNPGSPPWAVGPRVVASSV